MRLPRASALSPACAGLVALLFAPATIHLVLQDPPPGERKDQSPPPGEAGGSEGSSGTQEAPPQSDAEPEPERPLSPEEAIIQALEQEVERLVAELLATRTELATARLRADEATRELDELRQFIADNREYGDDFAQYREIKRITEESERRKAAEAARQRRADEAARRRNERHVDQAAREAARLEEEKIERYAQAGFQALGLDTYIGRTGFFYNTSRTSSTRVEYEPHIGHFLEPIETESIDYSKMTISGTVLNASDEVRNIGIAVAFFDSRGNQVGAETILINNARPNIPYPFTSTIDMALDRPFSSSTSWVLYADPVETTDDDSQAGGDGG